MSVNYSAAMRETSRELRLSGQVTFPTGRVKKLEAGDFVSLQISEGAQNGILPGNVLSAECRLALSNASGEWSPGGTIRGSAPVIGAVFELELSVKTLSGWVSSPLGTFVCAEADIDERSAVAEIRGQDELAQKMGGVYEEELEYPCTLQTLWESALEQAGYEWDEVIPLGTTELDGAPAWSEGISVRGVVSKIAAAAGCFVRLSRENELELVPVRPEGTAFAIGPAEYLSRRCSGAEFGPVNEIRVTTVNRAGDGDSEVAELCLTTEEIPSGVALEAQSNPLFLSGSVNATLLAQGMLSRLAGLTYRHCEVLWRGDPTLTVGTPLRVTGVDGEVTECILSRQTLKFENGFTAECLSGVPDAQAGSPSVNPDGTLNAGKLVGQVRGGNIAAQAITATKLAAGAVTADKIAAGAVTAGKLDANAVTAEKIAAGSVDTRHLAAGAVTTEKLAALSVKSAQLDAGAVTAEKIAAGSITADRLRAYLITADSALVANGAIGTAQIADGSITSAKVVSLNADVITAGTLSAQRLLLAGEDGVIYRINAVAGELTAAQLAEEEYQNQLDGTVIVAKSLTAAQIAAQSITGNEIAAGTICASHLDVGDLFASQAVIDELNAVDLRGNPTLRLSAEGVVEELRIGGRNLIVRTGERAGFSYGANGTLVASSDSACAQYAAVEAGEEYVFSRRGGGNGTISVVWYDANKAFLSRVVRGEEEFVLTAPTNARYARASYPPNSLPKMERGNKASDWSPAPEDTSAELDALKVRMSGAETQLAPEAIVSTVRGSTLYQQDLGAKADVSELSNYSTISQTESRIALEVGNIRVGGRNLLRDSDLTGDGSAWTERGGTPQSGDRADSARLSARFADALRQTVTLQSGGACMLSFEVRADRAGTVEFEWGFVSGQTVRRSVYCANAWQRVVLDGVEAEAGQKSFFLRSGSAVAVTCLKLEEGNIATGWSPAPEDPASELKSGRVEIADGHVRVQADGEFSVDSGRFAVRSEDFQFSLGDEDGENVVMAIDESGCTTFKGVYAANLRNAEFGTVTLYSDEIGGMGALADYLAMTDAREVDYYVKDHDYGPPVTLDHFNGTLQVNSYDGKLYSIPRIIGGSGMTGSVLLSMVSPRQQGDGFAVDVIAGMWLLFNIWFSPGVVNGVHAQYGATVRWLNDLSDPSLGMNLTGNCFLAEYGGQIYASGSAPGGSKGQHMGLYETFDGGVREMNGAAAADALSEVTLNGQIGYYGSVSGWHNTLYQGWSKAKGKIYGSIAFDLSGVTGTIVSAVLTLHRKEHVGLNRAANVNVYGSAKSRGSNPASGLVGPYVQKEAFIRWNGSGAIDVTEAAQAMKSGTIRQLVLYTGESGAWSSSESYSRHYAEFDRATLQISYA